MTNQTNEADEIRTSEWVDASTAGQLLKEARNAGNAINRNIVGGWQFELNGVNYVINPRIGESYHLVSSKPAPARTPEPAAESKPELTDGQRAKVLELLNAMSNLMLEIDTTGGLPAEIVQITNGLSDTLTDARREIKALLK